MSQTPPLAATAVKNDVISRPKTEGVPRKTVMLYALWLIIGAVVAQVCFVAFLKVDTTPYRQAADITPAPSSPTIAPVAGPVVAAPVEPLQSAPVEEPPVSRTPPALALSGVFVSSNSAYAIINDEVVKLRDTFQGCKVVRITAQEVELDFQGEKIILSTRSIR